MKKILAVILSLSMLLASCKSEPAAVEKSSNAPSESSSKEASEMSTTRVVTDIQGRKVEIPSVINSFVALGPSGMRLMAYLGVEDKAVGIELIENESDILRPYNYLHPEIQTLPVVSGSGKGGLTPYEEEILKVKPDVILLAYSKVDMGEELQTKLGIPVVFINTKGAIFQDEWFDSMDLAADIFGVEERAEEIRTYVNGILDDLRKRTKDIEVRPSVYYGAAWFHGEHSLEGTLLNYPPFSITNINHVADELASPKMIAKGTVVDLEKILEWDPEILFMDVENFHLVEDMYKQNPEYFKNLDAFKNDRMYAQLSYNNYGANLEMAIINAYYAGSVVYPERFEGVDVDKVAEDTFNALLGASCWEELKKEGYVLSQLHLGK